MQKSFIHVEIPEEEVLLPDEDPSTSSGLDFSRKDDGYDSVEEAMRDNDTFKTSLGKILFMTKFPKLDSLELSTNCDGKFQSYILAEETIITPIEEVRKDFMQSILCELADADILFPHNESLFDSEEALDSQIIASSVDFVSSLQTELAECTSENLLLRQEVNSLTLQLTNARTQLAAFEQQAAWKSLENMRLSTSNSKLQKKMDSLKSEISDNVELNLNVGGIDQTQGEFLAVSDRLRACEEELALKQDICYSQGRQLVELRRQLDLNDTAEKGKRSSLQQSVGSMKLFRDGSSASRMKSETTRSAFQRQQSSPARIKLFSSSIDEDFVNGKAVSGEDKEFLQENNFGDTEDALFAEYPHQQRSETVLLKSTPLTSLSIQRRRGSTNNTPSSRNFNKPAQIRAGDVNDELFMKINDLEVALRVRSAEVTALMCQLSDAEFRREDETAALHALAAAQERISQLELELMVQSSNGFNVINPKETAIDGLDIPCEKLVDVRNNTSGLHAPTVNYQENNADTDSSRVFFQESSTLVEFESVEVPLEESRQVAQLQVEIEQLRQELMEHACISNDYETLKLQLERVQEMQVSDQKTFDVREAALVSQVQILERKLAHHWKVDDHKIESSKSLLQEPDHHGSLSQERVRLLTVDQAVIESSLERRPAEVDESVSVLEKGRDNSKILSDELICFKEEEFESRAVRQGKINHEEQQALNGRLQEVEHNEGLLRSRILELTSTQATIEASLDSKSAVIEELTSSLENEKAALRNALLKIATLEENLRSSEYNSKLLIDELTYVKVEFESMRTEVLTQSVNESSMKHQCQIISEALLASEEQNISLRGQLTEVQCEAEALQTKVNIISSAHQDLINIELKKLQDTVSNQSSVNEDLQFRLLEVQRNANESSINHVNKIRELEKNLADNAEMYNLYQQQSSRSLQEKQQQLEEIHREIFILESRIQETDGLLSRRTDELDAVRDSEAKTMKALEDTLSELTETNRYLAAEQSTVLSQELQLAELRESAQILQEIIGFGSEDVAGGRWYAHSLASREIEESLRTSLSDAEGSIKKLQLQNEELNVKHDSLIFELQKGNEHLLEQSNLLQHFQSKLLQCDQQLLSERESRERNEVEEVLRYSLLVLENEIRTEDADWQRQRQLNEETVLSLNERIQQLSEEGHVKDLLQQNSNTEMNILKQRVEYLNEEKEMLAEDHRSRHALGTEGLSQLFESTIQMQSSELERLSAALIFEQSETSRLSEALKRLKSEFDEYSVETNRLVSSLQRAFSLPLQPRVLGMGNLNSDTDLDESFNVEELKAVRELCLLSVREHSALLESTKINSLQILAEQTEKTARLESTINRQAVELSSLQAAYDENLRALSDQAEKISLLETTCDHIQRLREEENGKLDAHQLQISSQHIEREAELEATYRAQMQQISDTLKSAHESNLQIVNTKAERIVALELAHEEDLQTIKDLTEKNAVLEEGKYKNQSIINDLGIEMNNRIETLKALVVVKESDILYYQHAATNSAMLLQELWQIINTFIQQNPCISLISSSIGNLEELNPMELLEIDASSQTSFELLSSAARVGNFARESPTLAADDSDSKEVWEIKAEKEISGHRSLYDNNAAHDISRQKSPSAASEQTLLNDYNSVNSGSNNLVEHSISAKCLSATISGLPCTIMVIIY